MNKALQYFKELYDPQKFQAEVQLVTKALSEYLLLAVEAREDTVYTPHAPEEEIEFWENLVEKKERLPIDTLVQTVAKHSMHLHHPRYMGHQVSPVLPLSAIGGLVSDVLNNGMGVYEMGEAGTALEALIVEWIAEKVGYGTQKCGFLTSGGSLANLTALLCARSSFKTPLPDQEKLAVLISTRSHYSVERAIRILGMEPVRCPIDANFKLSPSGLTDQYMEATQSGLHPIAVVGNACTTATGTYDDLNAVADFCHHNNLWFHIDGAHGVPVIFSKKYRGLLNGIERAHSISMDFHKMMLTPALNTVLLFKDPLDSYRTYIHEAEYLFENEQEEWFNIAKRSFECTKYMMGFKIFLLKYYYGDTLFETYIDQVFDLTRAFAGLIKSTANWEVFKDPEANIICFRYIQPDFTQSQLNKINAALRKKVYVDAKFYIVQTTINVTIYLRCSIMNPLTVIDDCQELLTYLQVKVSELLLRKEMA